MVYVNILQKVDKNYIIPTKNEMIDENNTYYLFIPINLSRNCSLGQYYDSSKYACIQCPYNEFTINQNELCENCVEGGRCINGSLFNQEGNCEKHY